jgi:hypothetical protein
MIQKNQTVITDLDTWAAQCGPKSRHHWKDERSAKEAVRAWLGVTSPALPIEVEQLLAGHSDFGVVTGWSAEPEARVRFDRLAGEPANVDLLVDAWDDKGPFVLAVEAKADETFGPTVADALAGSVERKLSAGRSMGIERIERLAAGLLSPRENRSPKVGALRYQLLTAAAATPVAAEQMGATRAVLLVHEFNSRCSDPEKERRNAADLDRFITRLARRSATAGRGELTGRSKYREGRLLRAPRGCMWVGRRGSWE